MEQSQKRTRKLPCICCINFVENFPNFFHSEREKERGEGSEGRKNGGREGRREGERKGGS